MVREAIAGRRLRLAYQPVVLSRDTDRIAFHEGLMRVLLLKVDEHSGYEPLASLLRASESRQAAATAIDVASGEFTLCTTASIGSAPSKGQTASALETECAQRLAEGGARTAWLDTLHGRREIFSVAAEHAPTLLLCGAGPDAEPVAEFAARLGWQVTIVDHRSAYVDAARFPAHRTDQRSSGWAWRGKLPGHRWLGGLGRSR